jgi:hypothetical protein
MAQYRKSAESLKAKAQRYNKKTNKEKRPKSYKRAMYWRKRPKLIKKEQKVEKFRKESRGEGQNNLWHIKGQRIKRNKSKGLI